MSPTPQDRKRKQPPAESSLARRDWAVTAEGSPPKYITEVSPNDVLMGRGKPIITNEGNKRFRCLVRERKEEYSSTSRTHIKEAIARAIITEVSNRKGHFLELVQRSEASAAGFADNAKVWKVVNVRVALNKVKQSLRDKEYVKSEDRATEDTTLPDPRQSSLMRHPAQPNLPTGLSTILDDQRRFAMMQHQALIEQERNGMLLRTHQQQLQGLQRFPAAGAAEYNTTNLMLQQATLSSAKTPQGIQLFPLGYTPNQMNPLEPNDTTGAAAMLNPYNQQQRLRDISMSNSQLMMGQQNAASNILFGGGFVPFSTISQDRDATIATGGRAVRRDAASQEAPARPLGRADLGQNSAAGNTYSRQEPQPLGPSSLSSATATSFSTEVNLFGGGQGDSAKGDHRNEDAPLQEADAAEGSSSACLKSSEHSDDASSVKSSSSQDESGAEH